MGEIETGSKMSIIRIVQVLLRESDKDHPLSQQDILNCLEGKYGMVVSRKSVSRNLTRLKEAGLPVMCREVPRVVNGKAAPISLDWYWDHVLPPEDLKLLIDLLYFSHLPAAQIKQVAEHLKLLQIRCFDDGKSGIRNLPISPKYGEVNETVALLSRAVQEKKQISFYYDHYEADGKRHHGLTGGGEEKLYQLHPFYVVAADGRYCLLGSEEGREMISFFYVDLMDQVTMLEAPSRSQKSLETTDAQVKPSEFVTVMKDFYSGSEELCTFEADWRLMTDIVIDFGKAAHLASASQGKVQVEVTITPSALKAWALKHAPYVKVTSPVYLAREVKEAAQGLASLYGL